MANASSAVTAVDAVVHTQYNNLRLDAIGPYDADRVWNDNQKATFGTGSDAFITYDGTNLVVDPKAVGSGVMSVLGSIMLETSASLKVSSDEILSDASGTMTLKNIDALDATTEATIEAAIDTLGSLSSASALTTVGTITSGVWQGTAIASSYIGSHTHTESEISNLGTAVALVADNLSVFAATTSAELRGVISNETGTGSLVFATSPTLVTPALGTPSALVGTNITGTAANLTAGTVTTNANLTGHVTSSGNAAVLGSFTKAQLSAAVSDGTVLYSGDATSYADADAIAAVEGEGTLVLQSGATIGGSAAATVGNKLSAFAATTSAELRGVISDETGTGALVFATSPTFVTPALGTPASGVATNLTGTAASLTAGNVTTNANLTGHVTSTGNAAVLGSFTKSQLSAAVSDGTPLYSGDVGTYTAGDGLDVTVGGEFSTDLKANGGLEISSTELSVAQGISQYDVAQFTTGVVDNDFLRIDGTAVEGRSASEVLSDIGAQASLTFGISNTNAVKVDAADVADDEYARFTANGLESRSTSEVLSDIGAQASLTFGISNTNAVKVDAADVADDEYARFTANGLESRSTSEVLSDIGAQASLTFGISNTNAVKVDAADVADDEYARFTANGLESRTAAEVAADIEGSIDAVGTIASGTWQGTAIAAGYIADAFIKNDADDTTTGTITAGGFTAGDAGQVYFSDTAPASDHTATGVVISIASGESVAAFNAVYIRSDGEVGPADADEVAKMPSIGVALEAKGDGEATKILIAGVLRDDTYNFTPGADLFIGTTAGEITATAPSGSGDTVQKIGVALTADSIYVNFNTTEVLLA